MYLRDLRVDRLGEYIGKITDGYISALGDLHIYTQHGFHVRFAADEVEQLADILKEHGERSENG